MQEIAYYMILIIAWTSGCYCCIKKMARPGHQVMKIVAICLFFCCLCERRVLSVQFTISLQSIRKPRIHSIVILDDHFPRRGQEPRGHQCSQALKLLLQARGRHVGGSVCIALLLARRLLSQRLMIPYRHLLIPAANSPWLQNGPQFYFLFLVKVVGRS